MATKRKKAPAHYAAKAVDAATVRREAVRLAPADQALQKLVRDTLQELQRPGAIPSDVLLEAFHKVQKR